MSQIGTGKAPNRFFTMFLRFADWLGSARRENDDISADALRIASLEAANADLKAQTRAANIKAMVWQVKAEDLQDKLDAARLSIANLEAVEQANWPFVVAGMKRKAADARYDAKRRGK